MSIVLSRLRWLSVKNVGVDADGIFIRFLDLMESVLDKPSFPNFSRRNNGQIAPILQVTHHFFRLFRPVAEILGSLISLVNKGISQLVSLFLGHISFHF